MVRLNLSAKITRPRGAGSVRFDSAWRAEAKPSTPLAAGGGAAQCDPPAAGTGSYSAILRPTAPNQWPCVVPGGSILEPNYFWGCQEAAGDVVDDVIGAVMTAHGAPTYQQAITDWTTKWLGTAQTAGEGFSALIDTLWNVEVQSIFALWYSCIVQADALTIGGCLTDTLLWRVNAAGTISLVDNGGPVTGAYVYENLTPTPHPFGMTWDRRGSGKCLLTTDQEELSHAFTAVSDNKKALVAGISTAPPEGYWNMLAVWVGTRAEAMIDRTDGAGGSGMKTLIGDLGWSLGF